MPSFIFKMQCPKIIYIFSSYSMSIIKLVVYISSIILLYFMEMSLKPVVVVIPHTFITLGDTSKAFNNRYVSE